MRCGASPRSRQALTILAVMALAVALKSPSSTRLQGLRIDDENPIEPVLEPELVTHLVRRGFDPASGDHHLYSTASL